MRDAQCGRFAQGLEKTGETACRRPLAEPHVRAVLDRAFAAHRAAPRFAMLVPVEGPSPHYRLYLQGTGPDTVAPLAAAVQAGLEENPHYRYAVGLKQLAPVEVYVLAPHGEPGWRTYERRCLERGQKCGDIKPAALDPWTGWPAEFERAAAPAAASGCR